MSLSPIVIGCVHSHAASILPFKEVLSVSLTNSKFRRLHHFVAFCFWVSLQPLLLTAFYAYPAVDDYAMGRATHLAYQSSGSLLTALLAALTRTVWYYNNWIGYYFSSFLSGIQPGLFSEKLYPIGIFFNFFLLIFGTLFLIKKIFSDLLGVDIHLAASIAYGLLFICLQGMEPGSARVEGFYWFAGAIYTGEYGLMLFFFGFLCKFFLLKEKKKILRSGVLLCFFGFLLGGANFMTSLTCVLVSSLLALFLLLQKKGRRLLRLLAPVLCLYFGFLLACLAPGNRLRQTGTKGLSPLQAVLSSFRHIFTDVGGDFLSLPVILLFLLLLPLLLIAGRQAANACAQNHPAFFRHPLLVICLCLCLSASNITPPLYATANIDAGRIRALMWEQFVLLLGLGLFYLAGWITSIRHLFGVTSDAHPDSFSSPEDDRTPVLRRAEYKKSSCTRTAFFCQLFYGIVLLLFLLRSAYLLQVNPRYYMSTSAITDLANGNMRHYRAECGKREKIFHDASVKKVSLSPLHNKPELLFFQDFSTDPQDWLNQAVAEYYQKESVEIAPETRRS